jgi:hypothetical protein
LLDGAVRSTGRCTGEEVPGGRQAQQLKQVLARCPALDRPTEQVRAFAELMNDRRTRNSVNG